MKMPLRMTADVALMISIGAVAFGQHYTQTNLISNKSGIAEGTDPELVNSWGLSRGPGSAWWVADNVSGVAALYNGPGTKQSLVVTVPAANPNNKNTPTGTPTETIFNGSSTDFLIAPGIPANFLFATLDGSIAAWNPNVALAPGTAPPFDPCRHCGEHQGQLQLHGVDEQSYKWQALSVCGQFHQRAN
jgi:hypothetical protein